MVSVRLTCDRMMGARDDSTHGGPAKLSDRVVARCGPDKGPEHKGPLPGPLVEKDQVKARVPR